MADIINLASSVSSGSIFNTGIPLADIQKKKMRGLIFLDSGTTFTGSAIASVAGFISELKDKAYAARGGRAYPLFDLLNFEDNTGDPSTGAIGNLTTATIVTSDAVPAFRFGYNGTEARHQKMSAMNSMSLDVLLVDEGFTIYGTAAEGGGFGGYSVLQAYEYTSKFPVSDAVNQYSFRLTLGDISQYRENSKYVVTNSGILAAPGLINVNLVEISQVSNVVKLQPISEGGTNLEPLHGAALAALTFTAKNLETGSALVITGVADSAGDNSLAFTMNSTAWGALNVGDKVEVYGPTPAAMAAVGIKPYEIVSVVITKA